LALNWRQNQKKPAINQGVLNIHKQALLIAKIVPDKAQSDDNADALARFATQYGAILASAIGTGLFFAAPLVKIDA